MSPAPDVHLLAAAVHLVPVLVWGTMAYYAWELRREQHLHGRLFLLLPVFCTLVAVHFVAHTLMELTPTELEGRASGLHAALGELIIVAVTTSMAVMRHLVWTIPLRGTPPSGRWLWVNYGSAALVNGLTLAGLLFTRTAAEPVGARFWSVTLPMGYAIVMSGLALVHGARLARRGSWRPGVGIAELRRADIVVLGLTLIAVSGIPMLAGQMGAAAPSLWGLVVHTGVGLGLAVPIIARILGGFARAFLLVVVLVALAVGVPLAGRMAAARIGSPEAARLLDVVALVTLLWALGPGQIRLRAAIDRVLFRKGALRQGELRAILRTIPPEVGVAECCRRLLPVFTRVMDLRGAAILLRDGTTVRHGDFTLGSLASVWPRDTGAADELGEVALRELPVPLRDALAESEVGWVAAINGPRGRWGHVFASQRLLSAPTDLAEVSGFLGQMALLLDTADLLTRTIAVERSLAHSEKLAAIGETAARIAHEIRNPVTAARSLAQQLLRDAASAPDAEAAELITVELGRVERQVANLLRFARREELRLEPVDLGALATATIANLRPSLDAAGVSVALDTPTGVVARADREKVRQVLINLIENARDALADASGRRELAVGISGANGTATIVVRDSGPGVPADALPRLFEPFFSLKPQGTGLGLAIVRRTIDAHGGRITVAPGEPCGLVVCVELPRAPGDVV